jgi:hypothetical protein
MKVKDVSSSFKHLDYGDLMQVEVGKVRQFKKYTYFFAFSLALLVFWIAFPKNLSGDETLWNELAFQATNGRLYVDVFDHKDPGFLFAIIWSYKLLGPMGLPVMSFVTKLVVFFLPSIWLMRKKKYLEAIKVLLVALFLLLLPGMREGSLPITLTNFLIIVAVVAALEHRFFASGFIGALTLFVKLSIAPTWLLAMVLGTFFYKRYSTQVKFFLAGAITAIVLISFLLWHEGILPKWFEVIRFNKDYSSSGPSVRLGKPVDHLGLLKHDFALLDISTKYFIFFLIVFVIMFWVSKMVTFSQLIFRPLILVIGFGLIGSILTLGFSYIWLHHVQVLLPWLILGAFVVVTEHKSRFIKTYRYAFQIFMISVLAMSGNTLRIGDVQMSANFDDRLPIPTQWNNELIKGSKYGYLSQNTGFFGSQLPKNLELNCPDLAAFPWTSFRLDAHGTCLAESDFVFAQELDFVGLDSNSGHDAVFFNAWVIGINHSLTYNFCEVTPAVELSNRGSIIRLFVNRSLKSECN